VTVVETPKKAAPVIFAAPGVERNTVVVFRYGIRRGAEPGAGASSNGSSSVSGPQTPNGAGAIDGITNPVSVSVVPSPMAAMIPQ